MFKVCIYADPCTVYEQKQRWVRERNEKDSKTNKKNETKTNKKNRIRAKLMLCMDIVDDDDDDQLYPAICSILPVQYSRLQLYYCNKN